MNFYATFMSNVLLSLICLSITTCHGMEVSLKNLKRSAENIIENLQENTKKIKCESKDIAYLKHLFTESLPKQLHCALKNKDFATYETIIKIHPVKIQKELAQISFGPHFWRALHYAAAAGDLKTIN